MAMRPLGAQISHALRARGVTTVFGIPGVHNIELYRGLREAGLTHVLARHEQGAGFMADGYARATGKPGIAYVITGPGVTNAMTAMGQAYSDSVPMIVLSSCLERRDLGIGRGRLHEMKDQQGAAATVTAWSLTAMDAATAYRLLDRAFTECALDRPRPRHIQVPTDVPGPLNMGEVIAHLSATLPDDADTSQQATPRPAARTAEQRAEAIRAKLAGKARARKK